MGRESSMGPSYVTVRGDRVNIAFKGSEGTNKNFTLYFTFVKYSQIVQSVYQS